MPAGAEGSLDAGEAEANIIGWMLVLIAVGSVILGVVTTLLLGDGSTDVPDGREPGHS